MKLCLTLAAKAGVTKITGVVDAVTAGTTVPTAFNATAAGYKLGTNGTAVETVYGGALTVSTTGTGNLTLAGSAATVNVTAAGGAAAAPTATLVASDVGSLTVNLKSAYATANTTTGAATVAVASFVTGTIADTSATTYNQHLESLSSLTVTGSGHATITNSGSSVDLVSLTTIDVSGMTAIYDKEAKGAVPITVNSSTTTITLNANAAETVILGGAQDTVITGSTVARMDTITGFQLAATATSATTVDVARSDKLDVADGTYAKFTTTATTLVGALTEAGAHTVTNVAADFLVFHFGGDTYVYNDTGAAGLDDADGLVKMTGLLDLDLLIAGSANQTGVLI
jgi:hypothetical protein